MPLASEQGRRLAAAMMTAALEAVDPAQAVGRHVSRDGRRLHVAGRSYDLDQFDRIFVVGGGKAGLPMAAAVTSLLGDRFTAGAINVKHGYTSSRWQVAFGAHPQATISSPLRLPARMDVVEAGHPVPDDAGLEGALRIRAMLEGLTRSDLVICLLSGGGSALLPLPVPGITLAELRALTSVLLGSGATITEFNTVRKHCSQLKGGQLARHVVPATLVCLILSDVVGGPLDSIASGPTVPDPTTFTDAYAVLERYRALEAVPGSIIAHLQKGMAGEVADTPKEGDPCFDRVQNVIIGDNRLAALAAESRARDLGLRSEILTTYAEGEARDVGKVCAALAKEMADSGRPLTPPACLILGGETTVTLRGKGRGGRNQELALAAALALAGWERTMIASLATDGTDGPTDAAGALVDGDTITRAQALGLDARSYLADNDSYTFFAALGDLVFTGPTNTNVNDLIFVFAL